MRWDDMRSKFTYDFRLRFLRFAEVVSFRLSIEFLSELLLGQKFIFYQIILLLEIGICKI